MLAPSSRPWHADETLAEHLEARGYSRRDFLGFCAKLGAVLGLSPVLQSQVVQALESQRRPSVIWLQLQECTGCVESVLRTDSPSIGDLILEILSLDYQHTLMAAAGHAAESARAQSIDENRGKYLLVVTGSIPLAADGIYTTIGGRTVKSILEEAAAGAAAVIAVGACAHWGNIQAARPNPTGAVGVSHVVRDKPVVNIAGCPPIADVITATIVHYLTFQRIPALDADGRPLFAYGKRIHDQCPRRAHYDAGQYVEVFDDEAARRGWCLYKVGCKGPATFSPCPIIQWNSGTSWPIGAGHPCIGCTERNFWDTMSPFYRQMPDLLGFGVERTADVIGLSLAVGAGAGVAVHALGTAVRRGGSRSTEAAPSQPDKGDKRGND
jgi:hydrogenase small subunit